MGTSAQLLTSYRPRTGTETADVVRLLGVAVDDPFRRTLPLHLTGSAVIVHPPTRRVLLRWHARQQAWLQVGGHGDPGETDPLAVALREAAEETGLGDLTPWPDASLLHAVVVPVPAGKGEPAHEHGDLRFVLATSAPGDVRPEQPNAPLRWLSVADARELTGQDNLRETLGRLDGVFAAVS